MPEDIIQDIFALFFKFSKSFGPVGILPSQNEECPTGLSSSRRINFFFSYNGLDSSRTAH